MPRPAETADNAMDTVLDEHDAALAQAAQRCLMAALDHSRAATVRLVADGQDMPSVELPPKALRLVADMLGMMAQRQPVVLLPQKMELSTQDAAAFLNVSRPFVVKQIDEGRLPCRKVGRHRRILFDDLLAYQQALHEQTEAALQALADQAQALGLDR
ncbi:helix-turn-helix domain-containing protein [Accumulibacter sp.]|uniref:helix-turn-helix domain-containing protein n=1 Tax=Accumulibacter sp. TaxID=2053492 RepID=UPI0025C0901B|nr:helix-turn-helix domain-containing protein [Accumulibacter sp.]